MGAVGCKWGVACASIGVALAMLLGAATGVAPQEGDTVVLRFEEATATVINARHRDKTFQQWRSEHDDGLFFDAVHRFLLLRFPGCAEEIRARLPQAAGLMLMGLGLGSLKALVSPLIAELHPDRVGTQMNVPHGFFPAFEFGQKQRVALLKNLL